MDKVSVRIKVNGALYERQVEARLLLVDFIREELGLKGTHIGCDTSHCGACTVLLNGENIKSCTFLAVQADDQEVTTVEGLASDDNTLHPIQQAFWNNHALQCGYCTPGMLMSAVALLSRNDDLNEQDVRHGIAGNLCRCTGYQFIVDAILETARSRTARKA
jgi:aerobic-type carbon monoxide dehydrogenase small subunit (CoxS/CutS family)